jgi:DNA-binding transcriptional ArsR family regulator
MLNHMVEYSGEGGLDSVYGALAHRVRRELVGQLSSSAGDGAKVTDLAGRFEISLAAVSKHIRVLEDAGLVKRSIRGREHHLSLDGDPLGMASLWLEPYRRFWNDRLDVLEALLRKGGTT